MSTYVINGSTLTAIANAIRENAPDTWEGYEMFPTEMPDMISDVRQEGWDEGWEEGMYFTWYYFTPFIIQGSNLATATDQYRNSDTNEYETRQMYPITLFENKQIGQMVWDWNDNVEYEVMISGSDIMVGFINHTDLFVDVFATITVKLKGGDLQRKILIRISPTSSRTWGVTEESTVRSGSVSIDGLRFNYGD